MKTDHDLFVEFFRFFFSGTGASPVEVEERLHDLCTQFTMAPPRALSDEEFATQLAQLKKEAPAFLHDLLNMPTP